MPFIAARVFGSPRIAAFVGNVCFVQNAVVTVPNVCDVILLVPTTKRNATHLCLYHASLSSQTFLIPQQILRDNLLDSDTGLRSVARSNVTPQ